MDTDAVIQKKIEEDADFQATLADLSDEEKEQAINAKKPEVLRTILEETEKARAKAEEIARDQKIRAEKAEQEAKQNRPEKKDDLSTEDLYALIEAKVPKEDMEEVKRAAKLLGKPIAEALNDTVVKTILSQRAEVRESALAADTGGSKRTTTKETGEDLLLKAKKGQFPTDDSDISKMISAKFEAKKKK